MRAYYMDFDYQVCVLEISYERETPQMLLGAKYIRGVLGSLPYVPSRVLKSKASQSLRDALDRAYNYAANQHLVAQRRLDACNRLLAEIEEKRRIA